MGHIVVAAPGLMKLGPMIDVRIGIPEVTRELFKSLGLPTPRSVPVKALIDSGARRTVIVPSIAEQLTIQPVSSTRTISPGMKEPAEADLYKVSITIPGGSKGTMQITECVVMARDLHYQRMSCLIGRDILAKGVFLYDGRKEEFALFFNEQLTITY